MTEEVKTEEVKTEVKMTKEQRYYALHREQKLSKYHNNPNVIAKREERERKKAEKEAEKEAKRQEKERIRQEKQQLAAETRRNIKKSTLSSDGGLNEFLNENLPVGNL